MPDKTGAPHGGAALLRRTSVFAEGENLGAGRIHFARAFEILQDSIKITTPLGVVIFMEATPGFELARMCKMLFHAVQEIQYFQWFAGFSVKCCKAL